MDNLDEYDSKLFTLDPKQIIPEEINFTKDDYEVGFEFLDRDRNIIFSSNKLDELNKL